jgi:D-beta-D-heptose 7-phosphate kinase/D-beta-D-heptose 1-phosphate adenosyltransferase
VWLFHEMKLRVGKNGIVVVLINTDEYLLRHKGRVLVPLEERRKVLEALRDVDDVLFFGGDDPCYMIRQVKPDFWFKGPEYAGIEIPELHVMQELGGAVVFPEGGPTVHTSEIIARVCR